LFHEVPSRKLLFLERSVGEIGDDDGVVEAEAGAEAGDEAEEEGEDEEEAVADLLELEEAFFTPLLLLLLMLLLRLLLLAY
jgi:hypothetical protein